MSLISALAIYFIIWWLVLFTILPWGIQTQAENKTIVEGTPGSAPQHPHLGRKAVATTLLSGVIFALVYVVMTYKLITLDDIPLSF